MATPGFQTQRDRQAAKLYSGKKDGGGHDGAAAAYYDRRDAKLVDDREGLELSRRERQQVLQFARKRGISAADLQAALAVVGEHDALPKSLAAIETRRAATLEALRIELGGKEAVQALVKDYVRLTTDLAKEIPSLAERVNTTGAGEDGRIIRTLAKYGVEKAEPAPKGREPQPATAA
jgi:hypothetical protein